MFKTDLQYMISKLSFLLLVYNDKRDFTNCVELSPSDRERLAHETFALSRTRVYVGGEHLLQFMLVHTSQSLSSSMHHSAPILITGEAGAGQETILTCA